MNISDAKRGLFPNRLRQTEETFQGALASKF